MNKKEMWKDIKGYEEKYQVSNLGRVKNKQRDFILKQTKDNNGYLKVALSKNKYIKHFRVHRLVAMSFLENENNYKYVNHINENKEDNRLENLEFCSSKYNCNYGTRMERIIEKLKVPVIQYDLEGNFIKKWGSIKEAIDTLKIRNISQVASGKRNQAGGYKWSYEQRVDNNANKY